MTHCCATVTTYFYQCGDAINKGKNENMGKFFFGGGRGGGGYLSHMGQSGSKLRPPDNVIVFIQLVSHHFSQEYYPFSFFLFLSSIKVITNYHGDTCDFWDSVGYKV